MTLLQIVLILSIIANFSESCGVKTLNGPEGQIKYNSPDSEQKNCTWMILPLPNTITTLRLLDLNLDECLTKDRCCLTLTSNEDILFALCNSELNQPVVITSRNNNITLAVESLGIYLKIWITFTSRNNQECSNFEYQCLDKSGCYNSTHLCTEDIICIDHSDYLGCSPCRSTTTVCNRYSNECYDPTKRCDGILDCTSGEDELNCSTLCPRLIKCPLENKCFNLSQICDFTYDCLDGFDEKDCSQKDLGLKSLAFTAMFLLCSIGCTLFVCMIFRWIILKRDMDRFLQNSPEFPLQPFEGPGAPNSESRPDESLDSEFRQGGEIFEHYMVAIRRKERRDRFIQAGTGIVPKYSHLDLDGDNELIVLASLNVPTDMCIGLNISDSSRDTLLAMSDRASTPSSCGDYSETYSQRVNSKFLNVRQAYGASVSMPSTSIGCGDMLPTKEANFQARRRRRSKSSSYSGTSADREVRKCTTTVIIEKDGVTKKYSAPIKRVAWLSPPRQMCCSDELHEVKVEEPVARDSAMWVDVEDLQFRHTNRRLLPRSQRTLKNPRTKTPRSSKTSRTPRTPKTPTSRKRFGYLCGSKVSKKNNSWF
ncbi:unnamed protein product [Psylliodes chrysocephalus]|uniref:CUB domain-containing protein n=1 Tax=Psylliodes chrysocephalus TaxID=3402493 RepID=A0A9P0CU05_9CUCU|nr:unnamed protein product [Psylliodes chrysocephala]